MNSPTEAPSLTRISREDVARYYLSSEVGNAIDGQNIHIRPEVSGKELWRLLEAFSHTYRANSVFRFVTDQGFDWYTTMLLVEQLTLTGMSVAINKIIFSEAVHRDPIALREYLRTYFAQHPHDDPEQLNECRPRPIAKGIERIIVREDDGKVKMVDGSHRFIAQLMSGRESVEVYYAKPNGKPHKSMLGDAVFLTMRRLYVHAETDIEKQAILATTRLLAHHSHDWRQAIQTYWIDYHSSDDMTAAARSLLEVE